jgi:hypothetical protein
MRKAILIAVCATAVLGVAACKSQKQEYNNASYNAEETNYAGNEAYGNATEYNVTNETNAMNNMAANTANTVTNNGY